MEFIFVAVIAIIIIWAVAAARAKQRERERRAAGWGALLVGIAAVAVAVAVITWAEIERWIESNKIAGGTAQIVRQNKAGKNYTRVSIRDAVGVEQKSKEFSSNRTDAQYERRMQGMSTITVNT
ncbi:hypothetical protein ACFPIJ_52920 [Dactylosporangium cerinum]|uniref:Uncharacterized protein n=1 Tax=Dactylosporangium cerinum TaxID=1434730 RepID=A0ABV9WG92_9ACTN